MASSPKPAVPPRWRPEPASLPAADGPLQAPDGTAPDDTAPSAASDLAATLPTNTTPNPQRTRRRRLALVVAGGAALLLTLSVVGLLTGSSGIAASDVARVFAEKLRGAEATDPVQHAIVWSLRTPRVVLAMLVGATLALAGTIMQGVFRNPLASPGILGTSTGASLGAVLALATGLSLRSALAVPLLAVAGALAALWVVRRIAGQGTETSLATLLLAGVALTSFLGALNSWIIAASWEDYEAARRIAYWTMGGIADRSWMHVGLVVPGLLLGALFTARHARDLDLLLEGDESAASLGVDVPRVQRRLLLATALLTGSAVAVSGVVGFVGLVVPHLVRLLLGPGHGVLLPTAALTGAWFLLGADLLARTAAQPQELHLGVVTAFLGAPFFLYLLARHRREVMTL